MKSAKIESEKLPFDFRNAYYIKLGRGGCWEADSIEKGLLRIGWDDQTLADINGHRWDVIYTQLRKRSSNKSQVVANDLNRLRDITLSTPEDIWITFHQAKLWWTRLSPGQVKKDSISKYRETNGGWKDASLKGKLLVANDLPGKIAMLQGFRGTACNVRETELLKRVIKGTKSKLATDIAVNRNCHCELLRKAITELHWKDYETLVDLVFRYAGWDRVSVLGQHAKAYDLELREPITGNRYVVQVKSSASMADLNWTKENFSDNDYKKVFFVVHSPTKDLQDHKKLPSHIELVDPLHLANLAFDAGLSRWIEKKVM